METNSRKVDISTGIILKTVLILLGLWFLFLVREVVVLLFLAVIIAASIDPVVDFLQKKKIPRSVGAMFIYIILFSIVSLIISFLIPPIVNQFQDFSQSSAQYFSEAGSSVSETGGIFQADGLKHYFQNMLNNLGDSFSNIPQKIFSTTVGVFSGVISAIVVFSMAFYMVMEEDGIKKFIVSIAPEKKKEYAADLTNRVESKIGNWMAGQLFLMITISILDFIGLYMIGIPYALILAIFAGVLEVVPYVGPIISAVPGIILGFLISPTVGFLAILVYFIAQQFESHVLVPQVMKKAVGLNPVATIVAILIGFKLAGALGAIIAVPAATAISLFISDVIAEKN